MLLGQCLLLGIVVFLQLQKIMRPPSAGLDKPLQIAALLVSFAAVFGGATLFKKKIISINAAGGSSTEKLHDYRKALTMHWAMVEGAALFAVICFFTAGNYSFVALTAALIIYFALQAPNKLKIMLQLQLSEQEAEAL